MKVVVSGAPGSLWAAVEPALAAAGHQAAPLESDPRDPDAAAAALAGAEALLHLAPLDAPAPNASPSVVSEYLDRASRGTYVLLCAAAGAGVGRVVLGSALALLERYPATWAVTEAWRPRPDPADPAQLGPYLAEASAREIARAEPLSIACLRLGRPPGDGAAPYDPRWLHPEDAAQALTLALTVPLKGGGEHASDALNYGWWLYHIPGGGAYTRFPLGAAGAPPAERGLGYAPRYAFPDSPGAGDPPPWAGTGASDKDSSLEGLQPPAPVGGRPVRNVVIFGAGGPLAAAAARALAPAYRLRLTDVRPLADLEREGRPQSPGAPLPVVLGPPHEATVVDVADPAQVHAACAGMDAVVNCTVVRPDPVQAFRVNTLGAIHVLQAAAAHGIRRVVHTGPLLVLNDRQSGYWWDPEVPDDAPGRPGTWLYAHSKYLGQEAARAFAEHYGLEVPALYFCNFVNPENARRRSIHPMTVSWEDAALALRRAVEAPSLPRRLEILHILADLPHGKYSNEKARRLLGWQPRDTLSQLYARQWPERTR